MKSTLFPLLQAALLPHPVGPAAPPAVSRSLQCEMRTPAADTLRFSFVPTKSWAAGPIRFKPLDVAGWSTENAAATPARMDESEVEYRVDGFSRPLLLRIGKTGAAKNATFFNRVGDVAGLPVAFGFCVTYELSPLPAPQPVKGDPFDPANWDGRCHFVAAAPGTVRGTFEQTFSGSTAQGVRINFKPVRPEPWAEPTSAKLTTGGTFQTEGAFIDPMLFENSATGLKGQAGAYIEPSTNRGSLIIRFNKLGSTNQPGFAICRLNVARLPRMERN